MKECDDIVKSDRHETIFHDTLQICSEFPAVMSKEGPGIDINVTKLRKTHINELVGICIKLLLRRVFTTSLPVFEEAFAKDLREAIWKVLNLHARHLCMKKGEIDEF